MNTEEGRALVTRVALIAATTALVITGHHTGALVMFCAMVMV